jgi:hypothetical protein
MILTLKRLPFGQPLEIAAQHEQRLTKRIAPTVFFSDALSSVASVGEAVYKHLPMQLLHHNPLVMDTCVGKHHRDVTSGYSL